MGPQLPAISILALVVLFSMTSCCYGQVQDASGTKTCEELRLELIGALQQTHPKKLPENFLRELIRQWVNFMLPPECNSSKFVGTSFNPSSTQDTGGPLGTVTGSGTIYAMSSKTRRKRETDEEGAAAGEQNTESGFGFYRVERSADVNRDTQVAKSGDVENYIGNDLLALSRDKRFLNGMTLGGPPAGATKKEVSEDAQMMKTLLLLSRVQKRRMINEYRMPNPHSGGHYGDMVSFGSGMFGDQYPGHRGKRETAISTSGSGENAVSEDMGAGSLEPNTRQKRFLFMGDPSEAPGGGMSSPVVQMMNMMMGTAREPGTGKKMELGGDAMKRMMRSSFMSSMPGVAQPPPGKEPSDFVKNMAPVWYFTRLQRAMSPVPRYYPSMENMQARQATYKRPNRNGFYGDTLPGKRRRKRSSDDNKDSSSSSSNAELFPMTGFFPQPLDPFTSQPFLPGYFGLQQAFSPRRSFYPMVGNMRAYEPTHRRPNRDGIYGDTLPGRRPSLHSAQTPYLPPSVNKARAPWQRFFNAFRPATRVQSSLPSANSIKPTLSPASRVQPTLSPASRVQHALPPANRVQPALPPANRVQPALPPVNRVQPALPPVNNVQPVLPPVNNVQPFLPPANSVQPFLPPPTKSSPFLTQTASPPIFHHRGKRASDNSKNDVVTIGDVSIPLDYFKPHEKSDDINSAPHPPRPQSYPVYMQQPPYSPRYNPYRSVVPHRQPYPPLRQAQPPLRQAQPPLRQAQPPLRQAQPPPYVQPQPPYRPPQPTAGQVQRVFNLVKAIYQRALAHASQKQAAFTPMVQNQVPLAPTMFQKQPPPYIPNNSPFLPPPTAQSPPPQFPNKPRHSPFPAHFPTTRLPSFPPLPQQPPQPPALLPQPLPPQPPALLPAPGLRPTRFHQ